MKKLCNSFLAVMALLSATLLFTACSKNDTGLNSENGNTALPARETERIIPVTYPGAIDGNVFPAASAPSIYVFNTNGFFAGPFYTDADGYFKIEKLAPAAYSMIIYGGKGYGEIKIDKVVVQSNTTTSLGKLTYP